MGTGNKKQAQTGLTTQTPPPGINSRATLQIYETYNAGNFRGLVASGGIGEARQKIARALIVGYEIAGIPPERWPSDILKPLIGDFILKNYGGFNDNDILNAFLFAVEGRFGSLNQENKTGLLELFNKPVSLLWINEILKAYSVWRAGELAAAARQIAAAATDPVAEHLKTRPLNNAAVKEVLIKTYSEVLEGIERPEFLLPEFYGFLEDNGLIEITTQEKTDLITQVEKEATEEARNPTTSGGGFLAGLQTDPQTITNRAKKAAILLQFKKFKAAGVNEYVLIGLFDRVCYVSPGSHRQLYNAQREAANRG